MRPFRLARIAAEAEAVRWRGLATRLAIRVVLLVVALLFLLGVVIFAHILAWVWIRQSLEMSAYAAAAILGGVDLLIALILLGLASRSAPSRVEREALDVRKRAVEGITSVFTMSQLAVPALRIAAGMRRRRRRG